MNQESKNQLWRLPAILLFAVLAAPIVLVASIIDHKLTRDEMSAKYGLNP